MDVPAVVDAAVRAGTVTAADAPVLRQAQDAGAAVGTEDSFGVGMQITDDGEITLVRFSFTSVDDIIQAKL